jgi:hypothetical protein
VRSEEPKPGSETAEEAPKKRGFWGRLFGRGDKKPKQPEDTKKQPEDTKKKQGGEL